MTRHVPGLDTIRFVSAAIVALGHFNVDWRPILSPIVGMAAATFLSSGYNAAWNGPAAVIVFFVLSGFVIHSGDVPDRRLEIAPYLVRRYIRILPPAIVFMIAVVALKGQPGSWNETVLWSLLCEAIYYALYPALRIIGMRKALVGSSIIAVAVVASHLSIIQANENYTALGYWSFVIGMPAWLSGCLIAEHFQYGPAPSVGKIWIVRCSVYLLSVAILIVRFHTDYWWANNVILLSIFIWPAANWIALEVRFFKERQAQKTDFLGKASFSLYLGHPLALGALGGASNSVFAAYLVLSAIVTVSMYFMVERPSHSLARRLGKWLSRTPETPDGKAATGTT